MNAHLAHAARASVHPGAPSRGCSSCGGSSSQHWSVRATGCEDQPSDSARMCSWYSVRGIRGGPGNCFSRAVFAEKSANLLALSIRHCELDILHDDRAQQQAAGALLQPVNLLVCFYVGEHPLCTPRL